MRQLGPGDFAGAFLPPKTSIAIKLVNELASKRATRPLGQVAQCSGWDAIAIARQNTKTIPLGMGSHLSIRLTLNSP